MKLRSAQFVLLVLLFTSLSLSEGSTLRLAGDFMGRAAVSTRTPASPARRVVPAPAASSHGRAGAQAASASALAASNKPWTMRAPAAHAAAVQALSGMPESAAWPAA